MAKRHHQRYRRAVAVDPISHFAPLSIQLPTHPNDWSPCSLLDKNHFIQADGFSFPNTTDQPNLVFPEKQNRSAIIQ